MRYVRGQRCLLPYPSLSLHLSLAVAREGKRWLLHLACELRAASGRAATWRCQPWQWLANDTIALPPGNLRPPTAPSQQAKMQAAACNDHPGRCNAIHDISVMTILPRRRWPATCGRWACRWARRRPAPPRPSPARRRTVCGWTIATATPTTARARTSRTRPGPESGGSQTRVGLQSDESRTRSGADAASARCCSMAAAIVGGLFRGAS